MKNHRVYMDYTIYYTAPIVVQEVGVFENVTVTEDSPITGLLVDRRLKIHRNNTIETEYYKVDPEVHEDLSGSCDSIINYMIDRNNIRELLELKGLTSFQKYLDFVSRNLGCNMLLSIYMVPCSIPVSILERPHIVIKIAEVGVYNRLPISKLVPTDIGNTTVCACKVELTLGIPSERTICPEDYEKYCCLLKKFSDTFIGNITKAKRILLMD